MQDEQKINDLADIAINAKNYTNSGTQKNCNILFLHGGQVVAMIDFKASGLNLCHENDIKTKIKEVSKEYKVSMASIHLEDEADKSNPSAFFPLI